MRRLLTWVSAFITAIGVGLITPATAQAAPYCDITWGSMAKSHGSMSAAPITNVRAGQHACFDRVVIDISGTANGYHAQYVPAVQSEGSGRLLSLRGGAFLEVVVFDPAYKAGYIPSLTPANASELVNVSGWKTLRQLAFGGSFEGYTTVGIGVRARLPFDVFVMANPTRIVIDVAHSW